MPNTEAVALQGHEELALPLQVLQNRLPERCITEEVAALTEKVLYTAALFEPLAEKLFSVLIAVRVQAAVHHLRGSEPDWPACLDTAAALLTDPDDPLAPACRAPYRELCQAIRTARSLGCTVPGIVERHADKKRVLQIYKLDRVLKALQATVSCVRAIAAISAEQEQLVPLEEDTDWDGIGECLGCANDQELATLVAILRERMQQILEKRKRLAAEHGNPTFRSPCSRESIPEWIETEPAPLELLNQEANSALTHLDINGCSNLQTGSLPHGAVCMVTSLTAQQASGKSDSRAVGTGPQETAELLAHPFDASPSPEYHDCGSGRVLQEAEEAAHGGNWETEQAPEGSSTQLEGQAPNSSYQETEPGPALDISHPGTEDLQGTGIEHEGQAREIGYQETEPGPALDISHPGTEAPEGSSSQREGQALDSGYQETEPGPALNISHPATEDLQATCASGNALPAPSAEASPALHRDQVRSQPPDSIVPDSEEPCKPPSRSADAAVAENYCTAPCCLENLSSQPGASQPGKLAEAGNTEVASASQMQVVPDTDPAMQASTRFAVVPHMEPKPSTRFDVVQDTDPTLSFGSLPLPLQCSSEARLLQAEQLPAGMSNSCGEAVGCQAAVGLAHLPGSVRSQPDSVASMLGLKASAVLAAGPGAPPAAEGDRQQTADPLASASVRGQPASGRQAAHLESDATHCTSEEQRAIPGVGPAVAPAEAQPMPGCLEVFSGSLPHPALALHADHSQDRQIEDLAAPIPDSDPQSTRDSEPQAPLQGCAQQQQQLRDAAGASGKQLESQHLAEASESPAESSPPWMQKKVACPELDAAKQAAQREWTAAALPVQAASLAEPSAAVHAPGLGHHAMSVAVPLQPSQVSSVASSAQGVTSQRSQSRTPSGSSAALFDWAMSCKQTPASGTAKPTAGLVELVKKVESSATKCGNAEAPETCPAVQRARSPQRWGRLTLAVASAGPVHAPPPKVVHHRSQTRGNAPSRPPALPMPVPPASRQMAAVPAATAKALSPQPAPAPAAAEQIAVPAAGAHVRVAAESGRASLALQPASGLGDRNCTVAQNGGSTAEAAAAILGAHGPGRSAALATSVGNQACRPLAETVRLRSGEGVGQQSVTNGLSGAQHCATAVLVDSRAERRALQQPAAPIIQTGCAPQPIAQPGSVHARGRGALPTPHARQLPDAARTDTAPAPTGSAAPLPGEMALPGADTASQSASKRAGSWSWLSLAEKAAGAKRPASPDTADADSHAKRLRTASFQAVVAAAVDQAKKGGGSQKVKLPLIVPKSFRSQHQKAQAAIRAALADGTEQKDPTTRHRAQPPAGDLGFDPQEESLPREVVQAVSQLPPPAAKSASAEPQGPPVRRTTGRPQPRVEQPRADSGSRFLPQPVKALGGWGSSMQLPALRQHHEQQQQQSHWGVPGGAHRLPVPAPSNSPSAPQHPSLGDSGRLQQQQCRSRFPATEGGGPTNALSDSVAAQQSHINGFGQPAHSGFAQLPGVNAPSGHLYNGWPQLGPGVALPGGQQYAAQPPAFWGHEVRLHAGPSWLPHLPQQLPGWPPLSAPAWPWPPHWMQPNRQAPETGSTEVLANESDHRPLKRPRLSPSAAPGDSNPEQQPTGDQPDIFRRERPVRSPPAFAAHANAACEVSAARPTAREEGDKWFLQPPRTALAPPAAAECAARTAPGLPLQDLQSPHAARCRRAGVQKRLTPAPATQPAAFLANTQAASSNRTLRLDAANPVRLSQEDQISALGASAACTAGSLSSEASSEAISSATSSQASLDAASDADSEHSLERSTKAVLQKLAVRAHTQGPPTQSCLRQPRAIRSAGHEERTVKRVRFSLPGGGDPKPSRTKRRDLHSVFSGGQQHTAMQPPLDDRKSKRPPASLASELGKCSRARVSDLSAIQPEQKRTRAMGGLLPLQTVMRQAAEDLPQKEMPCNSSAHLGKENAGQGSQQMEALRGAESLAKQLRRRSVQQQLMQALQAELEALADPFGSDGGLPFDFDRQFPLKQPKETSK